MTTKLRCTKPSKVRYICSGCGLSNKDKCWETSGAVLKARLACKLGLFHGFDAYFYVNTYKNVILAVGCRRFRDSKSATFHWKNRPDRPDAGKLINYAIKAAKKYRLNWK
jgi:hypothetical protein